MSDGHGVAASPVPWDGTGEAAMAAPAQQQQQQQQEQPLPPGQATHASGQQAEQPSGQVGAPGPESRPGARETGGAAGEHVRVDARRLEAALVALREPLRRLPLVLDCPGIDEARVRRQQILSQIDDYLLARLRRPEAPILIAMVGSTGAGKSTLLNSIVGAQVSATGIRRPTTNSPVLACHPDEVGWFAENVFLPTLPRVRQEGLAMPGRDGLLVLAASEGMPKGVAVLDTPDIDSVVAAHRQFARQFLDASDLWLFVTTARRYADAAVWDLLRDGRDRGAALGIVLSRVPPTADRKLTEHFHAMLEANGLGEVPRFVIPETTVADGQLPGQVSAPVRSWLRDTAEQGERRIAILTTTMVGVLDSFAARIPALAAEAETQLALRRELRSAADAAYAAGLAELDEALRSGALLRGEVLARWQDFVGAGDLLVFDARKGRRPGQRPRRSAVPPPRAQALKAALRESLRALIGSLADRAAEDALERWRSSPAGAGLLASLHEAAGAASGPGLSYQSQRWWEGELNRGFPGDLGGVAGGAPAGGAEALGRSSADLADHAERVVAGWQEYLLGLVQTENVTRRSVARVASFDPESLALVLTVGVLGYGAADVVVSEGASAVPQRLLTALFGAGLLRDIGGQARQELHKRVAVLFGVEAARFTALLDAVDAPDEAAPSDLYQASYSLEAAR